MQPLLKVKQSIKSFSHSAGVIHLKERSMDMLEKDLILRNPLRLIGGESEDILTEGGFGAVLARAGVGKTALLVQIALNTLLRSKNVLHISLNDPIDKVTLWYKEVFNLIARQYNVQQMNELWEVILPHRFIMAFKVEGFTVPKLQERLNDLIEQKIFSPQMIIIDGLPFDDRVSNALSDLKSLIKTHSMHGWLTVRIHRHEMYEPNGLPVSLTHVAKAFDVILRLQPEEDEIHIQVLKGGKIPSDHPPLLLDPTTMLIKDD